jgi:hypothetical protein
MACADPLRPVGQERTAAVRPDGKQSRNPVRAESGGRTKSCYA